MSNREQVLHVLAELGIPYRLFEHDPVHTIEDCYRIADIVSPGAVIPRNVFLCNRQQKQYYLMLMQPQTPFRTAVVSKQLGVSRLSFAQEAMLPALLGLHTGAVSPLGLLFDTANRVQLVMDRSLLQACEYVFHPCENTASVRLPAEAFLQAFLHHVGHRPTMVDCGQEA